MKYFTEDAFNHPKAPENANGEVILGSFYRFLGLADCSEGDVGANSKELYQLIQGLDGDGDFPTKSGLDRDGFRYVVENLLSSPRLKNQRAKEVVYLNPVVPEAAYFSCVARLRGNPWNPGAYLGEMLARGRGAEPIEPYLEKVRDALSISTDLDQGDDVWARFISGEMAKWCKRNGNIGKTGSNPIVLDGEFPSKRFFNDFDKLLQIKYQLPRRKWISLIESYLRLVIAVDILWYCHVHVALVELIGRSTKEHVNAEKVDDALCGYSFFEVSIKQVSSIEQRLRSYVFSSYVLSEVQSFCEKNDIRILKEFSSDEISKWLFDLSKSLDGETLMEIKKSIETTIDSDPEMVKEYMAKSKKPKNLLEALTYIPSRRNTVIKDKSSYDQGYWYNKQGRSWVFEPGPAAITVMVQLCASYFNAKVVSAKDLIEFLSMYGIVTNEWELSSGLTGHKLRSLGYVIDSPDLEGGILIKQPYPNE